MLWLPLAAIIALGPALAVGPEGDVGPDNFRLLAVPEGAACVAPYGVSDDGNVVVGVAEFDSPNAIRTPKLMRNPYLDEMFGDRCQPVVWNRGVPVVIGRGLEASARFTGVSPDGKTAVGWTGDRNYWTDGHRTHGFMSGPGRLHLAEVFIWTLDKGVVTSSVPGEPTNYDVVRL